LLPLFIIYRTDKCQQPTFAYEAIYKKWLVPAKSDLLLKSKYFMTLKKLNVSFYDSNRQVEEIKFPSIQKKIPKTYSKTDTTYIKTQKLNLAELLLSMKKKKGFQPSRQKALPPTLVTVAQPKFQKKSFIV
jgi:hypothetical protein